MKNPSGHLLLSLCLAVAGMTLASSNLSAATLNWAPAGDPNSNTGAIWTAPGVWNGATWSNGDDAVFNRTNTGTRTVNFDPSTSVVANSITYNSTAASSLQQVNGATGTTLTVTTGNFAVAPGGVFELRTLLTGATGVNITGGGALSLSNTSNNFTGTISATNSTLTVAGATEVLGNLSNSVTLNQGIMNITHLSTMNFNRGLSLAGDGTIRIVPRGSTGNQNINLNQSGGTISGSSKLTYDNSAGSSVGTNTVTVYGNNTYSGGTVVNYSATGITLVTGHANAFGTQGVQVQGNSKVQLSSIVGNNITVESATATLLRTTASAGAYSVGTTGTLKSSFAGGTADVGARIRSGTNGSGGSQVLTMGFAATPDVVVGNDAGRKSDIFSLDGTGSQTFTMQLSATGITSGDLLGWLNGSLWANAVTGNTGAGALAGFYAMSYDQFLANNGGSFNGSTMLGAWGVDTAGGNVWSVINYGTNADFAVVPEPQTIALMVSALGVLLIFRRRRVIA